MKRRGFLNFGAAGIAASALNGCSSTLKGAPRLRKTLSVTAPDADVSLVTGSDRRQNIYNALKPFKEHLANAIGDRQVFIKINCVWDSSPLCATHPDSIRGTLDFLGGMTDKPVIVGESTASPKGAYGVYEEYGILPLAQEYPIELIELNDQPTRLVTILSADLQPIRIRIINHFLGDKYFMISLGRPKTHETAIATMSLKNVVMGAPLKIQSKRINDKQLMHQGQKHPKMLHYNMYQLAHYVRPDFSIIDGLVGMEGNGPVWGTPVEHNIALASPDFLAADMITAELMGIPFEDLGYLTYCAVDNLGQGNRSRIKVFGENPEDHVIAYKRHISNPWAMKWKEELVYPEGSEGVWSAQEWEEWYKKYGSQKK
ncbi:DUF362 domain-containing protein [Candidatus Latescibacterota bacterium]